MQHTRPGPMTVALTVVAGIAVIPLDMTIVTVALAGLAQETGASLPVIQWVSTGYALGIAAFIPAAAWAIGRFGARQVFLAAIGLFTAGSALVASSWDVESLIAFRVLQGLAGGLVHPAAMTLVLSSAPPEERGRVMATLGLPLLVGPVLGPVLGGYLLDTLSWRWMFLINLPIGLAGIAAGLRNLPRTPPGPSPRLDVLGLCLLPPALTLLVLGASFAEDRLLAPEVLVPLGAGLVLLGVFVRHALRSATPLLDVRLLGRRRTGGGAAVLFFFVGGFFVSTLLIPLYWQVVRGESATAAGLLIAPAGFTAALTIQVSGRLIDRLPPLRVIGTGIGIAVLAHVALAFQLSADVPAWQIVVTSMVGTVGGGCTLMPTTTVATRSLDAAAIPSGSTVLAVLNQVSAAVFTAAVSVLLAWQLSARLPGTADGGVGSLNALPPAELAVLAPQVAESFSVAFWLAAALMAAAGLVALIAFRVPRGDVTTPGEAGSASSDESTARQASSG